MVKQVALIKMHVYNIYIGNLYIYVYVYVYYYYYYTSLRTT